MMAIFFSIEKIFPVRYRQIVVISSGRPSRQMPSPILISAVPTPLTDSLRIAVEPLVQHCHDQLAAGCDGIVLFGTTGEGTFFSVPEKLSALEAVLGSGLPPGRIILATGACALDEAVAMSIAASELCCAGALILPPFFTKPADEAGLCEWFDTLIARAGTSLALLLYHIPAVAGVGFSPGLVARLFDRHPGAMAGIKDSTPDSSLAKDLLARKLPGIHVSTEVGLAANVDAGMRGTISASLNVTVPFVRDALTRPGADARVAAIRAHLARNNLICSVKAALFAQTGDPAWSRLAPPHRPPEGWDRDTFLAELRRLEAAA